MKIILASASPRRRELLKLVSGVEFEVRVSGINEDICGKSSPEILALTLAQRKAQAAFRQGETVLGADTIVVLQGDILGKPRDASQARQMLMRLSGKKHEVITGICFYSDSKVICAYDKSHVEFKAFTSSEIEEYVQSNKPLDKAGAYGIQDDEIKKLTKCIKGSLNNIIGLPTELIEKLLSR